MLRSLFSGISGLRAHQTMMDITGNNIANINTVGYKSGQATFEDTLSQMVQAAGAPQGSNGGTNPAQVGLGVRLAGIDTNFTQGAAENTGRNTDLMIQGDGFFVVQDQGQQLYTRNGSFTFDTNGTLVTGSGSAVQGWGPINGVINTSSPIGNIQLPVGQLLPPTATSNITLSGNLPADATNAVTSVTPIVTSITAYDAQGNAKTVSASFVKDPSPATTWTLTVKDPSSASNPTGSMTLDWSGTNGVAPPAITGLTNVTAGPKTGSVTFNGMTVDLSTVTSFAGNQTITAANQNGAPAGSLQSFTISPDGTLVGVFSNGLKQTLAQVAIANFSNPGGLEKAGDSMYTTTANSGTPQVGAAGSAGRGTLLGGALEMSNVDLSQEFTNMVIAERGFQANARVITTSDEILQDLVNIKH